MKKLSEMKIAKEAVLSEMETRVTGGNQVGSNTNYYGPGNPTSIATYIDGVYFGQDAGTGSLYGDSWSISMCMDGGTGAETAPGQISVTRK